MFPRFYFAPTSEQNSIPMISGTKMSYFQENYNTPLEHTPGNPPFANYESGIPAYSLLVKVAWGVFQFGVLKQPQSIPKNRYSIYLFFVGGVRNSHIPLPLS